MGNQTSAVDPVHLRMYQNLIHIQDPMKRVQVIQTCFSSMEYIQSAKRAGLYSHLLHYASVASSGQIPGPLPGERGQGQQQPQQQQQAQGQGQGQGQLRPQIHPVTHPHGIAATHPSLVNAPPRPTGHSQYAIQTHQEAAQPSWKVVTDTPKQKAITYFSSCLEVLGIQEEVALTEETLKKAYKRMAVKAHPDKGGSEEFFEAVTRAYAYLSEILRHMRGGRKTDTDSRPASTQEAMNQRSREAEQWKHAEPVRLNAKQLDMNKFNQLFEETHLPDPDAVGYDAWLKEANDTSGRTTPMMKGEFSKEIFNRVFEEEARKSQKAGNQLVVHPNEMALTLNPSGGTELVAERPSSFTAATGSKFQFTDLRGAYTTEATITDKVSNVTVAERKLDEYRASRERAPDPLSDSELHGIRDFERRQQQQESLRERKKAEQAMLQQQYFDRMKRMVITDGVDLNAGGGRR
jgi:curved DNA-binding protein CbpA